VARDSELQQLEARLALAAVPEWRWFFPGKSALSLSHAT